MLDAYGWTDIRPACEFLLDYEEDEEDDDLTTDNRQPRAHRKKPWRYRWPDEIRDEILARLLDLNKKRAEEERLSGAGAEAAERVTRKKATKQAAANPGQKSRTGGATNFGPKLFE